MSPLHSYYDTNHDGHLDGFERVRYEEDNFAYPGSQVPDLITEEYEKSLRGDKDADDTDSFSSYKHKSAGSGGGYDTSDDYLDDLDEPSGGEVLDDPDDYGPEDQYWFAPKTSDDLMASCDKPSALSGKRLYAYRCYNCEHWDEQASCTNTRSWGCDIYDKRSVYECVDDCPPDSDGETCDHFDFRHGNHG